MRVLLFYFDINATASKLDIKNIFSQKSLSQKRAIGFEIKITMLHFENSKGYYHKLCLDKKP